MTTTTLRLTAEQQAIITHCRTSPNSLIVRARAGSGKTSTLMQLLPELRGTTCLQAFNKSIVTELEAKAQALPFETRINLTIKTCHALGLAAFPGRKPQVQGGKVAFILRDLMRSELDEDDDLWKVSALIKNLVGLAKSAGFGLRSAAEHFPSISSDSDWLALGDHHGLWDDAMIELSDAQTQQCIKLARMALQLSNQRLNQIDFDDMIYLPLLHNMPLRQYDNVLIDEAQDINVTKREFAFRSLTPNGRIIAVGDDRQAIYGFAGASANSLNEIAQRASAGTLPLTICWRCDGAIIAEAKKEVPDIECRPGAEEQGTVRFISWEADGRDQQQDFLALVQPGDAILCRLNKPNVATALGLLRRGKPARIEGRDLGARLRFHCERATQLYAHQPLSETLLDLDTYKEEQVNALLARKRETSADMLADEVDCAKLLIERCLEERGPAASWPAFERLIESLFGDNVASRSVITLSSVHKAKGREWPRVFILGRSDYMPFKRAADKGGWHLEQEHNLIYVAVTRAERELFYVAGVQSAIDRGLHRKGAAA